MIQKHIYLSASQDLTITLFVLWAYMVDAEFLSVSPYLGITAVGKRCGKSRLLSLIERLVPRGKMVTSLSESAFFRLIEKLHPTILFDELHLLLNNPHRSGLLQLFLDAYDRDKPVVLTNPNTLELEQFDIWGARVMSYLGWLNDALRDRVIEIYLERKPKTEERPKLRETSKQTTEIIRRKCLRWSQDNREAVRKLKPTLIDVSNDRAADNWEFLLAIAKVIDSELAIETEAFALALEGGEVDDDDLAPLVLAGLQKAFQRYCKALARDFADSKTDLFLPITWLCRELNKNELAEWSEWKSRKGDEGMTPHKLAKTVRDTYRVKPVRGYPEKALDEATPGVTPFEAKVGLRRRTNVNGYRLSQLRKLFEIYL